MRRFGMVVVAMALAACKDGPEKDTDDTDDTDVTADGWVTVAEDLGSALLSITGTSATDVWTVGANADGSGGLMLHYDGAWSRVDLETDHDLWWVWEASTDDVWTVGAAGTIIRYTPSTGAKTSWQVAENVTLFGIWGSGPDDIWTVGGNTAVAADGSGVWHYDGVEWTRADVPDEADALGSVFKVWGRAADDVWMCGRGLVMSWDGADWTVHDIGTTTDIFTITGDPDGQDVWVSGGAGQGVILHWDGATWTDESPDFAPTIPGIFAEGGHPVAAGHAGSVFTRESGAWAADARGIASFMDFHAAWLDPDGGVWAVGGSIRSNPLDQGTILYGGPSAPATYAP